MEIVGRAWNSKYNKNEVYFVFSVGNKEFRGVIGNNKCKLLYNNDMEIHFINNKCFKIKSRIFKLVKSTVKAYDYKVLME